MNNPISPQNKEVDISQIFIIDRQRGDMGDIDALKFSIEQYGLMQPIVVEVRPENKYRLIAGGRRLTAFKELGRKTIPAIFISDLDELSREELEYEENLQRKDLTWIEECKAVNKIHKIKRAQYTKNFPDRFGKTWTQKDTASSIGMSEGKISQDCTIADALELHPEIAKAANRKEALRLLRHLQENVRPDESLFKKKLRDSFVFGTYQDCTKRLISNSVDCIITDITNQPIQQFMACLVDKLTYAGNGYIFFPLEEMSNLHRVLREFQLPFSQKPFVWHVKGDDSYQTYLWFSRAQSAPPKNIPLHISCKRDKNNLHMLSKPYQVYHTLVVNSSPHHGLVVDPNSYDTTLVSVCIDHGRNVDTWCGNKVLHEQGILNA